MTNLIQLNDAQNWRWYVPWTHVEIAAIDAPELQDGRYVNVGVGLPTKVAQRVPKDMKVWL